VMPLFDLGHSDGNGSALFSLSGWTLGEVLVKHRKDWLSRGDILDAWGPDSVAWYRHRDRGRLRRQSECWDALDPFSACEVEVHVSGSQLCGNCHSSAVLADNRGSIVHLKPLGLQINREAKAEAKA